MSDVSRAYSEEHSRVRRMTSASQNKPLMILAALFFALLIPAIGYIYVGSLIAILFAIGYLGGFALWLCLSATAPWSALRQPYWTAFAIFIFLHKVEENRLKFFEVLGNKVTGIPVPEVTPLLVLGLLVLPLGSWLLIPYLVKRGYAFGLFLAWTFFTSFGVMESAHFVFPLLTGEPYGYFPGMASAVILVPAGWWGMWRLATSGPANQARTASI